MVLIVTCFHSSLSQGFPNALDILYSKALITDKTNTNLQKYLVPHLKPPTTSSFQQTSTSLEEQYDKAQSLLDELKTSTKTLQDSLESDREKINSVVEEVEGAVRSVKDNEERWRDEMREVRSEVESVRDLVPKVGQRLHFFLLFGNLPRI